jgi:peptide-methionine (R)-S-oxide reductase
VQHDEQEWKRRLTPEQYRILRQKGTEAPGTGALLHEKRSGTYRCAGCGHALFSSDTKFESGSGWPSFWAPKEPSAIAHERDFSHGMDRVEVLCASCRGHLGHVFPDGPQPTGQRYCLNSAALQFEQKQ